MLGLFLVRRISPSSLLYEQINTVAFFSTLLMFLFRNRPWKRIKLENVRQIFLVCIAVSFLFNTLLLNIDRSRSFYVLSWVSNQQITSTSGQIKITSQSKEATNTEGVMLRMKENITRGFIKSEEETYSLTLKGEVLLGVSKTLSNLFNLNNWKENEK